MHANDVMDTARMWQREAVGRLVGAYALPAAGDALLTLLGGGSSWSWLIAAATPPAARAGPGFVGGATTPTPSPTCPAARRLRARRRGVGHSHVLYAKSPGGAVASARARPPCGRSSSAPPPRHASTRHARGDRHARVRGRPDARASADLEGAAGLTQILAETGQQPAGPAGRRRGHRAPHARNRARPPRAAARGPRRLVDERFDPAKALEAAARYLVFAKRELGATTSPSPPTTWAWATCRGCWRPTARPRCHTPSCSSTRAAAASRGRLAAARRAGRRLRDLPVADRRGPRDPSPAAR